MLTAQKTALASISSPGCSFPAHQKAQPWTAFSRIFLPKVPFPHLPFSTPHSAPTRCVCACHESVGLCSQACVLLPLRVFEKKKKALLPLSNLMKCYANRWYSESEKKRNRYSYANEVKYVKRSNDNGLLESTANELDVGKLT